MPSGLFLRRHHTFVVLTLILLSISVGVGYLFISFKVGKLALMFIWDQAEMLTHSEAWRQRVKCMIHLFMAILSHTFVAFPFYNFSGVTLFSSSPVFCFFSLSPLPLSLSRQFSGCFTLHLLAIRSFTFAPSLHPWPTNRWVVCPETEVQGHQRGAGPRPQRHDFHVIFNLLRPFVFAFFPCTCLPCTTAILPLIFSLTFSFTKNNGYIYPLGPFLHFKWWWSYGLYSLNAYCLKTDIVLSRVCDLIQI